jgi:predicted MFS family arabinose efflux permease
VGLVGVIALVAGLALVVFLRQTTSNISEQKIWSMYRLILRNPSAVAAIVSSLLGSLYWFTWVTYLVVFFQVTYGLSEGVASTYSLTLGVGVLIGSQIGGRVGDRIGHRLVVAGTIVVSGVILLLLTNAPPPLLVAAAMNLALCAVIGARFATNTSLLTEQVPEARGTLFAFSSAVTSLSIVAGATIGGIFVDTIGFAAIGMFCMVVAMLTSAIVLAFVREDPLEVDIGAAYPNRCGVVTSCRHARQACGIHPARHLGRY